MAINPNPMAQPSAGELRQRQLRGVPDLPMPVTHYALDIEKPPLIACEAPDDPPSTTNPMDVTCPDCMSHDHFPQSVRRALQKPLPIQPESAPAIRAYDVLREAAWLLSEPTEVFPAGENPEYDRAIVELTSALIGASSDDKELMTRILRALKEGV